MSPGYHGQGTSTSPCAGSTPTITTYPHRHAPTRSAIFDGQPVPYVARPYKTIMLAGTAFHAQWDLVSLAQQFDLSLAAMTSTLRALPETSNLIKEVRITDSAVTFVLDDQGRTVEIESGRSSRAGEHLTVPLFIELACSHARHHARVEPTILILDDFLDRFHKPAQLGVIEQLEMSAEHAQVAVISHHPDVVARCSQGWTPTNLESSRSTRTDPAKPIDFEVTTIDPPQGADPHA